MRGLQGLQQPETDDFKFFAEVGVNGRAKRWLGLRYATAKAGAATRKRGFYYEISS